jgi:hypothetical protein
VKIDNSYIPYKDYCDFGEKDCLKVPEIKKTNLLVWEERVLCLKRFKKPEGENVKFWTRIAANNICPEDFPKKCGYINK